jgi:hypothetical protein
MISAAVSASGFAPASTILGAVCFVLKAAEGVTEVYEWIEELFDKLRDFTTRLDEYVQGKQLSGYEVGGSTLTLQASGTVLRLIDDVSLARA